MKRKCEWVFFSEQSVYPAVFLPRYISTVYRYRIEMAKRITK